MQELHSKIESVLFIEPRVLSLKRIAKLCNVAIEDIETAITEMQEMYEKRDGGITLVREGDKVQLTTSARHAEFIAEYLDAMDKAELTRPSLETLTIIAYRGPVAKNEIELIRGVNCSLILRNLMIRGLIDQVGQTETGFPMYTVTVDFLRHLGVRRAAELPNYAELNTNIHLQDMLQSAAEANDDFFAAETLREQGVESPVVPNEPAPENTIEVTEVVEETEEVIEEIESEAQQEEQEQEQETQEEVESQDLSQKDEGEPTAGQPVSFE